MKKRKFRPESILYVPATNPNLPELWCRTSQAIHITGRTRRTIQRWQANNKIDDTAALRLLQVTLEGRLAPPWHGWRVIGDALVSPEGDTFTENILRVAHLNYSLTSQLTNTVRDLEQQLQHERQQPVQRFLGFLESRIPVPDLHTPRPWPRGWKKRQRH